MTNRNQQIMSRRQHTYNVFQSYKDNDAFSSGLAEARERANSNSIPEPVAPHEMENQVRIGECLHIDYILDHYEFLCASIIRGDIDEKFMISCEYSRITRLYEKYEDYIRKIRRIWEQPTFCQNLQTIRDRWTRLDAESGRLRLTPGERLYEFVMLRPCRLRPRWVELVDRLLAGSRSSRAG